MRPSIGFRILIVVSLLCKLVDATGRRTSSTDGPLGDLRGASLRVNKALTAFHPIVKGYP